MNFPKRVPVLAKPQDGSSIRKVSSALNTFSLLPASIRDLSRRNLCRKRRLQSFTRQVTDFFKETYSFALHNRFQLAQPAQRSPKREKSKDNGSMRKAAINRGRGGRTTVSL